MKYLTENINNKIHEYSKMKLLLLLANEEHLDIQLEYLTEDLWNEIHNLIDLELSQSLLLEDRAEIHFDIETYLYTNGWPITIEFMGQWFYEKYEFEFSEERYTTFINQIRIIK